MVAIVLEPEALEPGTLVPVRNFLEQGISSYLHPIEY